MSLSRRANPAFRIIVILLTLGFIVGKVVGLKTIHYTIGDAGHNVGVVFAYWFDMLPQGFCVAALWEASTVFDRLSRGDAFNKAVVRGLRGIGLNLVLSALAAVVIVPSLKPAVLGQGWAVNLNIDIESITIGLIGLVMYLVARQGTAMKAELEQFV